MRPRNIRTIQTTGSNVQVASNSSRLPHAKWWRIRSLRADGANYSRPNPPEDLIHNRDGTFGEDAPTALRCRQKENQNDNKDRPKTRAGASPLSLLPRGYLQRHHRWFNLVRDGQQGGG